MRTLRTVIDLRLRGRVRSERIREMREIQDVVRWTKSKRRYWKDNLERTSEERLAKKSKRKTRDQATARKTT